MGEIIKNHGSDPATIHYLVTPSNTVALSPVPRALFAMTSGNVSIRDSSNTTVIYAVTAGTTLPFRALYVHTDSTANVVAWA